ncbi:gliding motility-associated-like protein [Algoriphagus chordae]|uniref:Gliding motility-associated-like protein n=2 Tax=Algoriphagus chordae TaxID=237019 RepID=A0A2W7S526_9BACT|nr:gliding motility-associated-like protein [Algoriphagus chordae]
MSIHKAIFIKLKSPKILRVSKRMQVRIHKSGSKGLVLLLSMICSFPMYASSDYSLSVTEPIKVTVTGKLALCSHEEKGSVILNVAGGVAPYSYRWNTLETSKDRTNLNAGTYTVEITDATGTTHIERIVVQPPYPLILSEPEIKDASCSSGKDGYAKIAVKVGRGEPYQITWSNGLKNTWEANRLEPGVYSVTVADKYHCDVTTTFEIKAVSEGINVSESIQTLSCASEKSASITLNVSGGVGPYTYKWSNGSTSQNLQNIGAGEYSVQIQDQKGCSYQASYSITAPTSMEIQTKISDPTCADSASGLIQLEVSGGQAPYTYRWNNGNTSSINSKLSSGKYTVVVTDAMGCSLEKEIVLAPASSLEIKLLEMNNASCQGANDGSIRLEVNSAEKGLNFLWDDGFTELNRNNLRAGTYLLTVSDESGCENSKSFTISEPNLLQAKIETVLDVDCELGAVTGVAWVSIQGGNQPYQITWNTGEKDLREINFSKAGNIKVNVTDATGCSSQTEVRVDFPTSISKSGRLNFKYRKLKINSEPKVQVDEEIIFESEISEEFIGWEWAFGDGNASTDKDPIHVFDNSGTFEVTLTAYDVFGCSSVEKNIIQVNKPAELITIPNAFTPNGDGLNDTFLPKLREVATFSMEIFNTWGEHIYSTSGLESQGWAGIYKGQASPGGNYLYKITYTSLSGEIYYRTGRITLIR